MVAAERISDRVWRVTAANPGPMTLTGTNTYLVGSGELVAIDPGPDLPEHLEAIVETAARLGRLVLSLVTHRHPDHLPGAIVLRERHDIPVAGHARLPGVDRPLEHQAVVRAGPARVRALHTPGHTVDHTCYFLEAERTLFTGDMILGQGTAVLGEERLDLVHYLDSLRLVGQLEARTILPGHGPLVADPAAKIQEYLAHRAMREQQVIDLLRAAPRRVDEIVARLYADVPPGLHPMAARNVRVSLWKLEHEGRAASRDEVWHLVGDP